MSRNRYQWRVLTEMQLIKRAHSQPDAETALNRFYEIRKNGGKPEVRQSEFHGYRVVDLNAD